MPPFVQRSGRQYMVRRWRDGAPHYYGRRDTIEEAEALARSLFPDYAEFDPEPDLSQVDLTDCQPLRDFGREMEAAGVFTQPQLDHWHRNRDRNGLDAALIRIGKRWWVDRLQFRDWFLSHHLGLRGRSE